MHAAFLVGISSYPDHRLAGVANDLALIADALRHRNYPREAIHVFEDSHTTQAQLHSLFAEVGAVYQGVEHGSCYLHISASGTFSLDPLAGGVLPSDGNVLNFQSAFPFAGLGAYLPSRPGVRTTVTLDT